MSVEQYRHLRVGVWAVRPRGEYGGVGEVESKPIGESLKGKEPSFGYADVDGGEVEGVVKAVDAAEKGEMFENGKDVDGVGRVDVGVSGRSFGWSSGDMPREVGVRG